jgi:hypothetical protein
MRKKGNPEFFEVFRRLPEAEKSRSWWSKKSKPAAPRPAASAARDTTTPPGRVALTFSREALAVLIPLLVIMLVASHVWGYKRGVNNMAAKTDGPARQAQRNEVAQRPAVEQYALSVPAGQPANATFVTLQLISLKSGQKQTALDLATALCADNHDAFVRKVGSDYTVNVGRFKNQVAAAASGLKERFAPMTYMKQKNLFKTCLYVQVTGTGSIVK